jgi:outer membrane protein OmpA-like peptidoglycan-associated protein
MLFAITRRAIGFLLVASTALVWLQQPARAQAAAPAANLADQLVGPETLATDVDVAALRQQVADRVQSKVEANALKRPPIAPQLLKLPQVTFDIVFDPDTPIIRPQSYATIGRIADALADPKIRAYAYLVVDHTESTGRRPPNLTLSQRRADAIRQILSGTFNISSKRLQSLGLGEEQLQDTAKPASPANARVQLVAIGTMPPPEPPAAAATSAAPAKKKSSGASKRH